MNTKRKPRRIARRRKLSVDLDVEVYERVCEIAARDRRTKGSLIALAVDLYLTTQPQS